MHDPAQQTVTVLLNQAREGAPDAIQQLFELVEKELRAIAEKQIRDERAGHSLQPTILIDDVFLRLVGPKMALDWRDRKHFYRTASRAMRRILIDHERARRAHRRGRADHNVWHGTRSGWGADNSGTTCWHSTRH